MVKNPSMPVLFYVFAKIQNAFLCTNNNIERKSEHRLGMGKTDAFAHGERKMPHTVLLKSIIRDIVHIVD